MEEGFAVKFGPLVITDTIITTWGIMLVFAALAWLVKQNLNTGSPGLLQTLAEGIVVAMDDAIAAVLPGQSRQILPFIGSLWVFLVVANLIGLIPGLNSPTRDLSATSALAILVFAAVHWYGIKTKGLRRYLQHYLTPSPILLPFHIISELSRTLALAVRLFGNMMSLETAALLILLVAGLLAPIPILMLHIIEALVQAYIFGMLALIYLASALQSQQPTEE